MNKPPVPARFYRVLKNKKMRIRVNTVYLCLPFKMNFGKKLRMKKFILLKLAIVCLGILISSCSDDEDDKTEPAPTTNSSNNSNNPSLPASVSGQSVNMVFTAAQSGAPYTLNQEVKVSFSTSGMLSLDENPTANDGDEVNLANFTKKGSEYVWEDTNNDISYNLSLKSDNSINELNVFTISNTSFLGSFTPLTAIDASLIKQFAGTYQVTQTVAGTHSRNTVIIDANGNIDFDTNKQINTSDFARIEDKLVCCDAITVDTKPYPTTPYGRLILYTDTTNNNLISIDYRPDHPSVTNRVEVKF